MFDLDEQVYTETMLLYMQTCATMIQRAYSDLSPLKFNTLHYKTNNTVFRSADVDYYTRVNVDLKRGKRVLKEQD